MSGSVLDPVLEIMVKLRNSWTLTGTLATGSLKFSTDHYDNNIQFPQVVISEFREIASPPLSTGHSDAYYNDTNILFINVWNRPSQDSNTSRGKTKNDHYQIRKEIQRIIRSGSSLGADTDGNIRHMYIGEWKKMPRIGERPLLLHSYVDLRIDKTSKGVGN